MLMLIKKFHGVHRHVYPDCLCIFIYSLYKREAIICHPVAHKIFTHIQNVAVTV